MNDTCTRCSRKGYGQTMYVIKLGEWRCRRHLPDFLKLDLGEGATVHGTGNTG